MKKILMLAVCMLLAVAAYAKRNYVVNVTYEIVNTYYDASSPTVYVGSESVGTKVEQFTIYADTQDEAESQAKSQCSTVCTVSSIQLADAFYNNVLCKVYQSRRVLNARAF